MFKGVFDKTIDIAAAVLLAVTFARLAWERVEGKPTQPLWLLALVGAVTLAAAYRALRPRDRK